VEPPKLEESDYVADVATTLPDYHHKTADEYGQTERARVHVHGFVAPHHLGHEATHLRARRRRRLQASLRPRRVADTPPPPCGRVPAEPVLVDIRAEGPAVLYEFDGNVADGVGFEKLEPRVVTLILAAAASISRGRSNKIKLWFLCHDPKSADAT
jgi:hypothetical protein